MGVETRLREQVLRPCANDDQLARWTELFTGLRLPRKPVCPGHEAPFAYLQHAYFEPTKDVIVWAPRGGGKTRLAAVATLLDLLHKPGCAVRILGGSFEQSLRMWEHLLPDVERIAAHLLGRRRATARRIELINRSTAAVLTQSQRAVRGLRVQKLRCDEVEMFDPQIWEAGQLVTKSHPVRDAGGALITGAIDALSTMHTPHGLMSRIIESATQGGTRVIRWCLMEVLERCPAERNCATCPLWDDCRGVAKTACNGFFRIDDAIAMKQRVSKETWEAEMLCRRPNVQGSVFPSFDPAVHVKEIEPGKVENGSELSLAMDFGFANPFVCLWIETRGEITFVLDEYVQEMQTIDAHLRQIDTRPWGTVRRVACDPAGGSRNDQTAASNIQVLRQSGYIVKARRSLIIEGLELIRAALQPASGAPRLFIHPRCKRLIRAMQSYHYGEGGSELPLKDGVFDHPIDALRYHFINARRAETARARSY